VSPLEKNRQRASELLARLSQPRGLDLHVIPQHRLLGVRMQIHLLVYPLGYRIAVQGPVPLARGLAEAAKRLLQLSQDGVRPPFGHPGGSPR